MRVCLGGTFEPLHAGHRALLAAAARDASEVFVGITDAQLADRKSRKVSPWSQRAAAVEAALRDTGFSGLVVTRALRDPMGPAASEAFDAIAASPETRAGALAINEARRQRGLAPLRILDVPHVLGDDRLPVSSSAIHAGRIDPDGRRLRPVRVAVGSQNPVKVDAVRAEFSAFVSANLDVKGHATGSGVPEQPRAGETLAGARFRARQALAADPDCDYAVGIEAGLVTFPGEESHLDAQACVIVDRLGWETHGWGPAFHYPAWVTERALRGEMISSILGPVAGDPRIGSTTGAIGYLSDGRLDRVGLTRQAVLMALVPRIRRALYT